MIPSEKKTQTVFTFKLAFEDFTMTVDVKADTEKAALVKLEHYLKGLHAQVLAELK
jgi:hypothetical protein